MGAFICSASDSAMQCTHFFYRAVLSLSLSLRVFTITLSRSSLVFPSHIVRRLRKRNSRINRDDIGLESSGDDGNHGISVVDYETTLHWRYMPQQLYTRSRMQSKQQHLPRVRCITVHHSHPSPWRRPLAPIQQPTNTCTHCSVHCILYVKAEQTISICRFISQNLLTDFHNLRARSSGGYL